MRIAPLALFVSALVLGSLALDAPAFAGVIVVDPAHGAGTDFTSLSDAIDAAVSGDVLLLRTGTYEGYFRINGKSVSVVADEGAQVTLTNTTSSFQFIEAALELGSFDDLPVVVRGLTLTTPGANRIPLVLNGQLTPAGHAFVEECNVPLSAEGAAAFVNRSPATVSRCTFHGAEGNNATETNAETGAAAGEGPLACFGGAFIGGAGHDGGFFGGFQDPVVGQEGSPGLFIYDATSMPKVLSGGTFIGGHGGDGFASGGTCLQPGAGGDGVLNGSGGSVEFIGGFGIGDLGGTAAPGCGPDGAPGALLASQPGSPVPMWVDGVPGSVTLPRARREGEFVPITVQAPLDQSVALLVGFAPQWAWIPSLHGVQVVHADTVVELGQLPVTGTVTFQWRVPELGHGVESRFLFLQPVTMQASGVKTLGQPSVLLMLDRSL